MSADEEDNESRENEAREAEERASQRSSERPLREEVHYEEVTLADLLDVLIRRKRLLAGTFLLVLLATVAITALQTPTFEASATIIPTNEKKEILSVMQSESFAEDVEAQLEANTSLTGFSKANVDVQRGTGQIGDTDKTVITIQAEHHTGEGAAAIANAYVATLEQWRPYFENITKDKKWEQYYEQADKNETKAQQNIEELVSNREYWRPLDPAEAASEPASPDWQLNLALGTTLAVMLALFVPFLVEGVDNALEERRREAEEA